MPIPGAFVEYKTVTVERGLAKGLKWRQIPGFQSFEQGLLDIPFQAVMRAALQKGGVFFDVGSNAGFYSLLAHRLIGHQGKTVCFEPLPENNAVIRQQLALNGITNCQVVETAVGNEVGSITFYKHKHDGALGSLIGVQPPDYVTEIQVPCSTLDALTQTYGLPDLVKIDVEGAETSVVHGSKRILADASRPVLFLVELHTAAAAREIRELFKAYGYTGVIFPDPPHLEALSPASVACGVFAHQTDTRIGAIIRIRMALEKALAEGGLPALLDALETWEG